MTEQTQQQIAAKKARIITISEAREILSKIDPEQTDQIQKRTMDYLLKFSKEEPEKAKKMRKMLIDECSSDNRRSHRTCQCIAKVARRA